MTLYRLFGGKNTIPPWDYQIFQRLFANKGLFGIDTPTSSLIKQLYLHLLCDKGLKNLEWGIHFGIFHNFCNSRGKNIIVRPYTSKDIPSNMLHCVRNINVSQRT